MQANFAVLYLFVAVAFFVILLGAFLLDRSTPKQHALSWMIILVSAMFWGLVLPLAITERSRKFIRQRQFSSQQRQPSRNWI
ncbi:MAG: hypothetical protein IGS50_21575 [Synechococcales cyanobacterium C42_A2020_086]|jgi:polyferredoxin|nr:hypothetical protein [Synechococcales cyanobacterium M58_A2018_015]MBF2076328.1 hypothetical protein [Synechococcales cyanobacterium C42_A2020_086]